MPYPLLPTKLYMPPGRRDGVLRPRLTARLLEAVRRPRTLALLSCPAGFGKTTLLAEFVQALARPVAWLSLDEADNDPVRFWSYVIAACQAVQKGIGDAALGMLQMPQPLPDEGIPALLIRELDGMDGELVLVLDDYQAIRTKSIQAGMRFLVEHQPERLHLLVSTRVDPPWPLARLRARNQLIELRAADLRFTTEEVRAFLEGTMGLRLSAEDSLALEARTEGWIASLQLAALSMQG
ncbi:MAG TPA: AAA family ATPase, partial [Anaerolineales bacterium]